MNKLFDLKVQDTTVEILEVARLKILDDSIYELNGRKFKIRKTKRKIKITHVEKDNKLEYIGESMKEIEIPKHCPSPVKEYLVQEFRKEIEKAIGIAIKKEVLSESREAFNEESILEVSERTIITKRGKVFSTSKHTYKGKQIPYREARLMVKAFNNEEAERFIKNRYARKVFRELYNKHLSITITLFVLCSRLRDKLLNAKKNNYQSLLAEFETLIVKNF